MFGLPVSLTITKGKTHQQTLFGGLLSIAYHVLILLYAASLLQIMIAFDDDKIASKPTIPDFSKPIPFSETRMTFVFLLGQRKDDGSIDFFELDSKLKQFVNLFVSITDYDYTSGYFSKKNLLKLIIQSEYKF